MACFGPSALRSFRGQRVDDDFPALVLKGTGFADAAGSFGPCAIRVRSGAREIDPSYIEDQNHLTGGLPTAGMLPSGEDRALVWAYDTNAIPIDPALTAEELKLSSTFVHGREIISLDRSR